MVVHGGYVTKGKQVKDLEQKVKEMYNVDYAISSASGTISMMSLLNALKNTQKLEKIVLPSFTWNSVLYCAGLLNLEYRFMDIDPNTYHMDGVVNWNEMAFPMDTFGSLIPAEGELPNLIVDACHSFGVPRKLRGIAEVFSFNGGKVVTAGEGGMIITNDKEVAKLCIEHRDVFGRMPELSAATCLDYIDMLPMILSARREKADYYNTHLKKDYIRQKIPIATNWYMYAVTCDKSFQIIDKYKDEIEFRKYYNPPLFPTPNAEKVGYKLLCLPMGYYADVAKVTDVLNAEEFENLV